MFKLILLTLTLIHFSISYSQKVDCQWPDEFVHYTGSYEDDFSCNLFRSREKRMVKDFPHGTYCGGLGLVLRDDSTYHISLDHSKITDSSLVSFYYKFSGRYTLSIDGMLVLYGDHPFSTNSLQINEWMTLYKRHIIGRGFKYKFSEEFDWISKKKRGTYCDGCELYYNGCD